MNYSMWDHYFHDICKSVAKKSPCLSRKIGAILIRDHSIVSTGYNGPPRGVPHCGYERIMKDEALASEMIDWEELDQKKYPMPSEWKTTCPRKLLGYESGTHMELCPAVHAESNAVINAARNGVSTLGCTLYMRSHTEG